MRYCLIICLFFLLGGLSAESLEVCADCRFQSVRAAIAAAAPGDEVLVHPGRYREGQIVIDKPLTLTGLDYPILDGEGQTEVLTIVADSVTVQGMQIEHVGTSYLEDRAGIRVRAFRHFVLRNNRLLNTFFGIYLEKSADGLIEGNTVIGRAENEMSSGNAIHAWYAKRLELRYNYVSGHRDGIYFEFVDDSRIEDNYSEGNLRYGLHFMFSNYNSYRCNEFIDNGAGVAVMFSKHIDMYDNLFAENWGRAAYGLLLKEINDAEISRNVFRDNTLAIQVEGANRIDYYHNDFTSNGWGIKMAGGCLDNRFTRNNFRYNTLDLVLNSKLSSNAFQGNYWSEYRGYDLDHDGVGDQPHRPVKLFAFVLDRTPESIVLLRSFFVDLINFAEQVSPLLTPAEVRDDQPKMTYIPW
ncbi:MAG: nitrous oxide reductase family maturation protein NosD [Lewinella sp.]|nr:nitrous oxide reductase family maturation protein NosD [Lewinella sp.]